MASPIQPTSMLQWLRNGGGPLPEGGTPTLCRWALCSSKKWWWSCMPHPSPGCNGRLMASKVLHWSKLNTEVLGIKQSPKLLSRWTVVHTDSEARLHLPGRSCGPRKQAQSGKVASCTWVLIIRNSYKIHVCGDVYAFVARIRFVHSREVRGSRLTGLLQNTGRALPAPVQSGEGWGRRCVSWGGNAAKGREKEKERGEARRRTWLDGAESHCSQGLQNLWVSGQPGWACCSYLCWEAEPGQANLHGHHPAPRNSGLWCSAAQQPAKPLPDTAGWESSCWAQVFVYLEGTQEWGQVRFSRAGRRTRQQPQLMPSPQPPSAWPWGTAVVGPAGLQQPSAHGWGQRGHPALAFRSLQFTPQWRHWLPPSLQLCVSVSKIYTANSEWDWREQLSSCFGWGP